MAETETPTTSERVRIGILRALYKESEGYASNACGAHACSDCGCLDVEVSAWLNANTGELNPGDGPNDDVWCPDCETTEGTTCMLRIEAGSHVTCDTCESRDCDAVKRLHRGTKWDEDEKAAQS